MKLAYNQLDTFPQACQAVLISFLGEAIAVESLGGLSGAAVARLTSSRSSIIAKLSPNSSERDFYRFIAPLLRERGLDLPQLIAEGQDGQLSWILIEDIPRSLPRSRWLADPSVIASLRRLHTTPPNALSTRAAQYTIQAHSATIDAAIRWVAPGERRAVSSEIARLLGVATDGLNTSCPVSGDANPTNWGVRENGAPVLYDWARFGMGPPELDLATTVPGFGTAAEYLTVARVYKAEMGQEHMLGQRIAIAKLWTVVELLAGAVEDGSELMAIAQWCGQQLPAWLAAEVAFLRIE